MLRASLLLLLLLAGPVVAQNTVVRIETNLGNFDVELFDDQAPATVANFLNYVRDGDFENAIIHRSVSDFVVQGGGFYHTLGLPDSFPAVPTDAPVANEPGMSNLRGTIAMAKVAGDPNSATSQWFINVADNTFLDSDNGGFTVFGQVLGNGMEVVDVINSIAFYNFGGAFAPIPLLRYVVTQAPDPLNDVRADQVVTTRIAELEGFAANPGVSGAWVNRATLGQGWLVDLWNTASGADVFIAWFAYDVNDPPSDETAGFASSQHRWLTLQGSMSDANSGTLAIFLNSAGVFNQADETQLAQIGSATIEFTDCLTGILSWDFDNPLFPDASVAIERLSPDSFCAGLAAGKTLR